MEEVGVSSGSEAPQASSDSSDKGIFRKFINPKILFPLALALIILFILAIIAIWFLDFSKEVPSTGKGSETVGKEGELDLSQINWANFINTDDVRDVVVDGDILWIGTLGGLVKFDRSQGKILATYSMADGLVGNVVDSLEKQGDILWIGMQGGISRFDTKTGDWRKFTVEEGLVNGANIGLALDGEDLWVGTFAGVSKYDTRSDTWTNFGNQEEWNVNEGIFVDTDAIWVMLYAHSGNPGGVARFDKETASWKLFGSETLAGGNSYRIDVSDLVIGPGKVWVSTINGTVNEYDKESSIWKELPGLGEKIQTLTGHDEYISIELLGYEEPYLVVSAYSYGFLFLYNPENGDLMPAPEFKEGLDKEGWQILYRLRAFGNNDFWFSVKNREEVYALSYFSSTKRTWEIFPYSNTRPSAYFSVLSAVEGELLIGTNRGLELFNPKTFELRKLEGAQVLFSYLGYGEAFYDRNTQKIWILEPGYGMDIPRLWEYDLSSKSNSEIKPQGPSEEEGWYGFRTIIGFPQKDQIWLPGYTELFRYTPSTKAWERFDVIASDLDQDKEEKIWVVTEQGVGEFSEGVVNYLGLEEGVSAGFTQIEVGEDALWLANGKELFSYDLKAKTWKKHEFPFGPPGYSSFPDWDLSPVINDLAFEGGRLWVATSRGLSVLEESAWRLYTSKEGLLGDSVSQIVFVSERPWVIVEWGGLAGAK